MRITARVRSWFANWRASRRRTTWDAGKDQSDWDTGDVSLLQVMATSQRMRHVARDWNEQPVSTDPTDQRLIKALVGGSAFLVLVAATIVLLVVTPR